MVHDAGRPFRPTDERRKTQRKYFQPELDRGSVNATAKVAQSLVQMAIAGKNVAAPIFWMKAGAGWREKHDVQVTARPTSELSDAQVKAIIHGHLKELVIGGAPAEAAARC